MLKITLFFLLVTNGLFEVKNLLNVNEEIVIVGIVFSQKSSF